MKQDLHVIIFPHFKADLSVEYFASGVEKDIFSRGKTLFEVKLTFVRELLDLLDCKEIEDRNQDGQFILNEYYTDAVKNECDFPPKMIRDINVHFALSEEDRDVLL